MKNPNGYGSVSKLSGKRRKPYIVRITTGWEHDELGCKQKQRVLGSYATREEALIALAEYNRNPYDLDSNISFTELYNRWSADKYPKVGKQSVVSYKAAYACCGDIYDRKFSDLKLSHLQGVIDNCGKNLPTLKNVRLLMNQLYKYALQNDLCDKDYSKFIDLSGHKAEEDTEIHKVFVPDEVAKLWEHCGESMYSDLILMLIYSGVRIGEMLSLRKADVHLADRYIEIRKAKTKSGVRKVPIADKVRRFYEAWMLYSSSEFLISSPDGKQILPNTYRRLYFSTALQAVGITENHLPHDTRHTCVSMLVRAEVNPLIIKRIVGHSSQDVTDAVYTHVDVSQLVEAINKI